LTKAARFKVPILIGVLPLHSQRHAEFIHNELPGVVIPESIRDRMKEAGEHGLEEGAAIARETVQAARGGIQGIYLIPAFGRYDVAAELVEQIKAKA
ncbi:MAG: bifunctional homocysteine S-methyltransferase/methylenetetrahydrofolate reductase, partial [Chloroflexi bacterium]|nr:bifunctional homocysteine S-methyltransferase/methylenetetrahydrofolate reductase [Chloroflexota bacterium]